MTGLAGGIGSFLGVGSGAARLFTLLVFLVSVILNIWILVLALYLLISAFIPRDDDPEDVRSRGFVIDFGRIILSLISLFFLGIGVAVTIYSLWLALFSIGVNLLSILAPPLIVPGVAGFLLAILGLILGLAIAWIGAMVSKKI